MMNVVNLCLLTKLEDSLQYLHKAGNEASNWNVATRATDKLNETTSSISLSVSSGL